MSSFMGPGKPNSLVTILSNRTSLLQGGLVEGKWGSQRWRSIVGSQDFIPRAETWFWPSRNFKGSYRTWDPWGHTYDVLVRFFPCRTYTDLNRYDTLGYEWPLARCYHLVVYLIVLDEWLDDGYDYIYYDDYYITLIIMLLIALMMLVLCML
jgi:hypothetical protein